MIDVPVRVKDALRSGHLKKNYRLVIGDWGRVEVVKKADFTEYTVENEGDYNIYALHVRSVIFKITRPGQEPREYTSISGTDPEGKAGGTFSGNNALTEGTVITYVSSNPAGHLLNISSYETAWREDFTLDNEALVDESVRMDERLCSGSDLKFGLCEGTSFEFQYFGDYPNINGRNFQAFVDIQYKHSDETLKWHTIPLGVFTVSECSRQASTGIRKVTAYNKLKSEYLDSDSTVTIRDLITAAGGSMSMIDLLDSLLDGYSIIKNDWTELASKASVVGPSVGGPSCLRGLRIYTIDDLPYTPPLIIDDPNYLGPIYDDSMPSGAYFYVWTINFLCLPEDIPESSTAYITNKQYKYIYNTPELWAAFQDVLNVWTNYKIQVDTGVGQAECVTFKYLSEHPEILYDASDYYDVLGMISWGGSHYFGDFTISEHRRTPFETDKFSSRLPEIRVPVLITADGESFEPGPPTAEQQAQAWANFNAILAKVPMLAKIYRRDLTPMEETVVTNADFEGINNITLRDLQSAVFEVNCQYGKLDRQTDLFAGIELNNGRLYPADNLYPANNLYPKGTSEAGFRSMYSKLWADEGNIRSFRYLIITYKGTITEGGQEKQVEKKLQRTVNANGTDDYNMSSNWIFKNFVWSDADVGTYADDMVSKMQNITWFPFEMWCAGLPFLEAGDEIEIEMPEGTYPSYVLRRTLKGIQELQDEMINGNLDIF